MLELPEGAFWTSVELVQHVHFDESFPLAEGGDGVILTKRSMDVDRCPNAWQNRYSFLLAVVPCLHIVVEEFLGPPPRFARLVGELLPQLGEVRR